MTNNVRSVRIFSITGQKVRLTLVNQREIESVGINGRPEGKKGDVSSCISSGFYQKPVRGLGTIKANVHIFPAVQLVHSRSTYRHSPCCLYLTPESSFHLVDIELSCCC